VERNPVLEWIDGGEEEIGRGTSGAN
jgi:hypothetical protein